MTVMRSWLVRSLELVCKEGNVKMRNAVAVAENNPAWTDSVNHVK